MPNVLQEGIAVGIFTTAVGLVVSMIVKNLPLPKDKTNWNRYHVMELSLFVTGFAAHVLLQITGGNAWYCEHGSACKNSQTIS
jgi:hypothetical protein